MRTIDMTKRKKKPAKSSWDMTIEFRGSYIVWFYRILTAIQVYACALIGDGSVFDLSVYQSRNESTKSTTKNPREIIDQPANTGVYELNDSDV